MTLVYRGDRTIDGIVVLRGDEPLDDRSGSIAYSAVGMDWGFVGPAARQLSFALLYDRLGDRDRAAPLVEPFTRLVTGELDNEWELDVPYLDAVIQRLERA